jgi:hypothetical protein
MRTRWFAALIAGALPLGLAGCVEGQKPAAPAPATEPAPSPTEPGRRFQERLLHIARNYQSYGQVDDKLRWAPTYCEAPRPAGLRVSDSDDSGTHGRKLYAVFALFKQEDGSYIKPGAPSLVNQAIVKESWVPEEVKDDGKPLQPAVRKFEKGDPLLGCSIDFGPKMTEEQYLPYARKDGKLYHAAKQADLFIMYKMDPETPGTDQGWVYGTVTPDGKEVTAAGRVESCMQCHQQAPHDRLFGLPAK